MALVALGVACGNPPGLKPDASFPDEPVDAPASDAPLDAPTSDGIAAARAVAQGMDLLLPIFRATVTSVSPTGNPTVPIGFTIQAEQMGPALLVAVDPTTLSPPPKVGDVVSFTITRMAAFPRKLFPIRALSLTDYTVFQTGTDVTPLIQNLSTRDLFTGSYDPYDAELVSVTGTVATAPGPSQSGLQQVEIDRISSPGPLHAVSTVIVRGPAALISGADMVIGCHITVKQAAVSMFFTPGVEGADNINAELRVGSASDYALTDCPAPTVQLAFAQSPTSVKLKFDHHINDASVMADGSQFTFNHGLTATAATVSGNTVMVTTSAQSANTNYTVTVAASVTDLRGSGVVASTTTSFAGLVVPAILRINEVNANIAGNCDLIELRVVRGGTMARVGIAAYSMSLTFTNSIVRTNDFIVVHTNPACNPGRSRNETVAVNEQPAAMFAANFDTAYDWYALDFEYVAPGLYSPLNVIRLDDAFGNIMDAVLLSSASAAVLPDYIAPADTVRDANQWTPATYGGPTFAASAVNDLGATGSTVDGLSIQRIDNNDTNTSADWTTLAGVPSTWGASNPGQTEFPPSSRSARRFE